MPTSGSFMMMRGRGHIDGKKQDLSSIANMLAHQVDRPVVDETGIKGIYDYTLDWTPADNEGGQRFGPVGRGGEGTGARAAAPPTGGDRIAPMAGVLDGNSGIPLLTAIQQQLGLKLEAKKVPLDLIVIDHAEKVPTEN